MYENLTEDEIFPLYVAEMAERCTAEETLTVTFDMATAQALLATLQLVFRHPLYGGDTAQICYSIAKGIEEHMSKTPAIAEVCRRGWLERYDLSELVIIPGANGNPY